MQMWHQCTVWLGGWRWCGGSIIYTALHQYELCPVPLKWRPGPGTSIPAVNTRPAAVRLGSWSHMAVWMLLNIKGLFIYYASPCQGRVSQNADEFLHSCNNVLTLPPSGSRKCVCVTYEQLHSFIKYAVTNNEEICRRIWKQWIIVQCLWHLMF